VGRGRQLLGCVTSALDLGLERALGAPADAEGVFEVVADLAQTFGLGLVSIDGGRDFADGDFEDRDQAVQLVEEPLLVFGGGEFLLVVVALGLVVLTHGLVSVSQGRGFRDARQTQPVCQLGDSLLE
jgi:hypothetical protein